MHLKFFLESFFKSALNNPLLSQGIAKNSVFLSTQNSRVRPLKNRLIFLSLKTYDAAKQRFR